MLGKLRAGYGKGQQGIKGAVIAEQEPGSRAVFLAQHLAKLAVHRLILLVLPHQQLRFVGAHISKQKQYPLWLPIVPHSLQKLLNTL